MGRRRNRKGRKTGSVRAPPTASDNGTATQRTPDDVSTAESATTRMETPVPGPSTSTSLKPLLHALPKHYLKLRAVGVRAAVINNEARILLGRDIVNIDFSNKSQVNVLEISGTILERSARPLAEIIRQHFSKESSINRDVYLGILDISNARSESLGLRKLEIKDAPEGLYCQARGYGKHFTNYYRRVCGLPAVGENDISVDVLEINGNLFDYLDMRLKGLAFKSMMGMRC